MALKNLPFESMIYVSGAWIDPQRDRHLLEAIPLVKPLIATIESAHHGVISTQKTGTDPIDAEIAQISAKEEVADGRHDHKVRGTYNLLTGLAELVEQPEEAQRLLDLRDRVLPHGLATTGLSYIDEAGSAEVVSKSLDAPTHAALKKVKTLGTRTLEDEVTSYIDAGFELGRLETEKLRIEQGRAAGPGAGRSDSSRARNNWVKAANALVALLGLGGVDGAAADRILGNLRSAEEKADRRIAARKQSEASPPAGPAPAESAAK